MRIVIADDQADVRSALRLLLAQEADVQIVGEAADATGLLQVMQAKHPQIVLLDWELPGLPADQLLRFLRFDQPQLAIVAMSVRPEAQPAALAAGADAFVSKGEPPERLLTALRQTEPASNDDGNK